MNTNDSNANCDICKEVAVDAYVLPCQHSYCISCLKSFIKNNVIGYSNCPTCRKKFSITDMDLSQNYSFSMTNRLISATYQSDLATRKRDTIKDDYLDQILEEAKQQSKLIIRREISTPTPQQASPPSRGNRWDFEHDRIYEPPPRVRSMPQVYYKRASRYVRGFLMALVFNSIVHVPWAAHRQYEKKGSKHGNNLRIFITLVFNMAFSISIILFCVTNIKSFS